MELNIFFVCSSKIYRQTEHAYFFWKSSKYFFLNVYCRKLLICLELKSRHNYGELQVEIMYVMDFIFFHDSLTIDEKYKIKYNYNVKMKSFPSQRYKQTEMCGTYL